MKILFPFLALALLGVGCVQNTPATQSSVEATFNNVPLNADDIAAIQSGVAADAAIVRVGNDGWTIPKGIDPMQVNEGVSFGDDQTLFAFVEQPNSWNPLWRATDPDQQVDLQFVGVLFSRDGGATWRVAFSISPAPYPRTEDQSRPSNPVGIFIEDGMLWLDTVDDGGAGSGEGVLQRYYLLDGQTWVKDDGCYYFTPEEYFDLSALPENYTNYDFAPIRPHNIKAIECPIASLSR